MSNLISAQAAQQSSPLPHFDSHSYGAQGDGVTYDTAALQRAINACGGTGGNVFLAP